MSLVYYFFGTQCIVENVTFGLTSLLAHWVWLIDGFVHLSDRPAGLKGLRTFHYVNNKLVSDDVEVFSLSAGTYSISVAWLLVFAINTFSFANRWFFKSEMTGKNSSTVHSSPGSIIFLSEMISLMHGMKLSIIVTS